MTTTFIQWKGTNLCMDFYCPDCNYHSHFDGMFGYVIECPNCHEKFEMPTDVAVKKVDEFTNKYWIAHPLRDFDPINEEEL